MWVLALGPEQVRALAEGARAVRVMAMLLMGRHARAQRNDEVRAQQERQPVAIRKTATRRIRRQMIPQRLSLMMASASVATTMIQLRIPSSSAATCT